MCSNNLCGRNRDRLLGWVNLISAQLSFTLCHGNRSKHSLSCQGFPGIMGSGAGSDYTDFSGKTGQQVPGNGNPGGGDVLGAGEIITLAWGLGAWLFNFGFF